MIIRPTFMFFVLWAASVVAVHGDNPGALLDSAFAGMRTASGYHVEVTTSDNKGQTTISGDVAGDDYDITVNSTARYCKVKGKFWSSQDNGQHWQAGAPDDEVFTFVKSMLKEDRLAGGAVIDKSRYVSLPNTGTGDKTVTCVEVWLGPAPLPNPVPDQADMPHYWTTETKDGDTWIERVQRDGTFHSSAVHVDARFTKINEIAVITPPGSDAARAPYVVTTPDSGVVVITVPGKKDDTPAAPETNSQIQKGNPAQEAVRENSLGMKFVPAGTPGVLFAIWDVRVKDFKAFIDASGYQVELGSGAVPSFAQTENDPVVCMSWNDAKMFCDWLTKKEQAAGKLGPDEHYRLPTDYEWSVAVGLNEKSESFPSDKDGKTKGVYPWGTQWPPPRDAGNYDESLTHDGFENTSPVGSFPADRLGLYDMGGNVAQWCEDVYGIDPGQLSTRTTRGGSYNTNTADWCLASGRGGSPLASLSIGFRVVLANHSEISLPEYNEMTNRNLKVFFADMWDMENDSDPAFWAADFAPTSQYCYKTDGAATRDYIQNDRAKLIKSWPDRTYTLIGDPVYALSPDLASAHITFSYSYAYTSGSRKAKGVSHTALKVEMAPNGNWLITEYNETVERNKAP